jgi:hypothetical protein
MNARKLTLTILARVAGFLIALALIAPSAFPASQVEAAPAATTTGHFAWTVDRDNWTIGNSTPGQQTFVHTTVEHKWFVYQVDGGPEKRADYGTVTTVVVRPVRWAGHCPEGTTVPAVMPEYCNFADLSIFKNGQQVLSFTFASTYGQGAGAPNSAQINVNGSAQELKWHSLGADKSYKYDRTLKG